MSKPPPDHSQAVVVLQLTNKRPLGVSNSVFLSTLMENLQAATYGNAERGISFDVTVVGADDSSMQTRRATLS